MRLYFYTLKYFKGVLFFFKLGGYLRNVLLKEYFVEIKYAVLEEDVLVKYRVIK